MVRIRLARYGAKKRPFYRVVVTDGRTPRGNRSLAQVGTYDPRQTPSHLELDTEKIDFWVNRGAQMTDTVAQLLKRHSAAQQPVADATPDTAVATDPAPVEDATPAPVEAEA